MLLVTICLFSPPRVAHIETSNLWFPKRPKWMSLLPCTVTARRKYREQNCWTRGLCVCRQAECPQTVWDGSANLHLTFLWVTRVPQLPLQSTNRLCRLCPSGKVLDIQSPCILARTVDRIDCAFYISTFYSAAFSLSCLSMHFDFLFGLNKRPPRHWMRIEQNESFAGLCCSHHFHSLLTSTSSTKAKWETREPVERRCFFWLTEGRWFVPFC